MRVARPSRRSGMTLIELVGVLGILAGLASMALVGAGEMGARGRRDETARRMEDICEAVAGDGLSPGRFVSDMGRLPAARGGGDGEALAELWSDMGHYDTGGTLSLSPPFTLEDDGGIAFTDSVEVVLPGGWNGPYVEARDGKLFDGWGYDLRHADSASGPWTALGDLSSGTLVTGLGSYGSDGGSGGSDWAELDMRRTFDFTDASLTVSLLVRGGSPGPPYAWMSPVDGVVTAGSWVGGAGYFQGDVVKGQDTAGNENLYVALTGGTSGSTPPTWPETGDVSDGTLSWRRLSSSNMNRMRVAVFVPYADIVPSNGVALNTVDAWNTDTGADWNGVQAVVLSGLTPGVRAVFAYGFCDDGIDDVNRWRSCVRIVDLQPGSNFIELHLGTPFS